jgi:hypothetical protein
MLPLLLSAALLAPAADTDPVIPPKGTPPTILVGQLDKKGHFASEVTVQQAVPETRTEKVNVNGKEEERTVTVYVMVQKKVTVTRDLTKATITDASGKKIDKKALAKRLAKPAAVVFSADGKAVDKGFLAVLKADTIVIVTPLASTGVMPPFPPEKKLEK